MKTICDISVTSAPIRSQSWSPAALFAGGDEGAWYDPSDTSTLFQDTAATVPATSSGDPVGCILDKSGHDHHALQPVSANRPTLQFDGKGLALLRFNGVNTGLTVAAFDPQSDKVQCVAGLHKNSDTTVAILAEFGVQMPYGAFYLTTSGIYSPEQGYGAAIRGVGSIRQVLYANPVLAAPVNTVVALNGDIAADSLSLRVDGSQVAQSALPISGGSFGVWPLDIGRRGNGNLHFDGDLYGLVLRFGTVQSTNMLPRTEHWMAQKTGVTL